MNRIFFGQKAGTARQNSGGQVQRRAEFFAQDASIGRMAPDIENTFFKPGNIIRQEAKVVNGNKSSRGIVKMQRSDGSFLIKSVKADSW